MIKKKGEKGIDYLLFRINAYIKQECNGNDYLEAYIKQKFPKYPFPFGDHLKPFCENDAWRTKIYNNIAKEIVALQNEVEVDFTGIEHAKILHGNIEAYIEDLTFTTNVCRDVLKQKYGGKMLESPLSILYVALAPFLEEVEYFKEKLEAYIPPEMLIKLRPDWLIFFPNKNKDIARTCLNEMRDFYNKKKHLERFPVGGMRKIFQRHASRELFETHYSTDEDMRKLLHYYGMDFVEGSWVKNEDNFKEKLWVNP